MQIKRDYSRPFFSTRRRRSSTGRFLVVYAFFMGVFLTVVVTQFDRLQLTAMDMVGMAPTPTPFASTLATRGSAEYLAGDVAAATDLFAQAVAQQPNNLDYLYEYGKLLIELDRAAEVIAPGPNNEPSMADRAIDMNPQDPRGYALKTRALVWEGDSANAIPVGVAGLEVDRNFAPLHSALGRAYTGIGRYQQGLERAENAVRLDPMDGEARRSYAYTLIWVGLREQAIEQLEEAIAINPNLTAPYFELALQYLASNQEALAVATYERVLALEPRNEKAYLRLCEAYSRVGQQDRAQGYCEDALTLNPNYAEAWRQVGMARYNRRNYEGSIDAFNRCVENDSDEIECWYIRGLAHYYLGQCDEAWTVLSEALPMAEELVDKEPIIANITEGLRLTTVSCPSYSGRALPTAIPPTAIPPTPIGGF